MSEEKTYTEAEAHRFFAIDFNGKAWGLLEKQDRTREDDELMLSTAHASLLHWLDVGTVVHRQRGEWLISRVYSVLGIGEGAVYYANRCLALTEQYAGEMQDFDWAYAYEAVARANAIAGNRDKALKYIEKATKAGEAIADGQSKEIFGGDFGGGDWAGVK